MSTGTATVAKLVRLLVLAPFAALAVAACSGAADGAADSSSADDLDSTRHKKDAGADSGRGDAGTSDGGRSDAGSTDAGRGDAGSDDGGSDDGGSGSDDGGSGSDDGPPTRRTCTGNFGTGMTGGHGRLDGYLVSIIPPGQGKSCNGDSSHVHLQIEMNGDVYDAAVNVDAEFMELDHALVDGDWSEGWHRSDALDYPSDLGINSGEFTTLSQSALAQKIEGELANANHVSIFMTGYNSNGGHLVHRQGSGNDGAVVIDPLSATPHYLVFHFSNQSF